MTREEDKFVSHFRRLGHSGDGELRDFYTSIEDKSLIDKVLAQYGEPPAQDVHQPNLASYKYSVAAWMHVEAVFGVLVTIKVPSLSKQFVGKGGGVLIAFGVSGGTLYYNDPDDLKNGSQWNANFLSVYANCNLFRNGSTYATYSGGGIPAIGLSGGSGDWKPNT
jgi:hypothetical protein